MAEGFIISFHFLQAVQAKSRELQEALSEAQDGRNAATKQQDVLTQKLQVNPA